MYSYKHAHTNGHITGGSSADGIITALFEPPELRDEKISTNTFSDLEANFFSDV